MGSLPPSEGPPEPTAAERQVADLIPIEADPEIARAVLDRVPLWFHTFSLDGSRALHPRGRSRPPLPDPRPTRGLRWDERARRRHLRRLLRVPRRGPRGAAGGRGRQRAVQGMGQLALGRRAGGEREVRRDPGLLDSEVDYRRLDAFDLDELAETFDLILCFGILHRVENPMGLLKTLRRRLAAGGRVLLETHGPADRALESSAAVHIPSAGEVYARDDFVYWGFTPRVWTRWPAMRASRASS